MAFKILWYSIPSLHDNSNGASISNKLILEKLVERGIEVKALNATVGDDISGMGFFDRLKQQISDSKNYYQFTDRGVEYVIYKSKSTRSEDITSHEQGEIFNLYIQVLEQYEPDLIIGYSGDLFSTVIRREAKIRGISVAYALCNGLHHSYSFPDCDLIFTTSQGTCDHYKDVDDIKVERTGIFIDPKKVLVTDELRAQYQPKYVTLINPSTAKGFAIFAKLALAYTKKHPEQGQRFLVVKSHSNYEAVLCSLHDVDGNKLVELPEDFKSGKQKTITLENPLTMLDVAKHTHDIRPVYALTKVLVAPSLWHESWGQVVTEANLNGIPVLATKNGGLYEAMGNGQGGIQLDIPASCKDDWSCMPTDAEIEPYVEALERLLTEDFSAQCKASAELNDIEKSVDRLIELFTPLMEQSQREKDILGKSFYFNAKYVADHKAQIEQSRAMQAQQVQEPAPQHVINVDMSKPVAKPAMTTIPKVKIVGRGGTKDKRRKKKR